MSQPVIALTTDFGQADGYVGTMKGVILGICPGAALVDVSHEIQPQAVRQAAYVLHTAVPYFPPGTVHLVVVDPGVGSARRPIVVQTERATYVAPDNGVLSLALSQAPPHLAVRLTEASYRLSQVSATFHGRDIFAPAAAHLACGVDPRTMGEAVQLCDLVTLPALQPKLQPDACWQGEVLYIDRFGNLVTCFQSAQFRMQDRQHNAQSLVEIGEQRIEGVSQTFTDVEIGELVAYVGSSGYLEIAVREGDAAAQLGVAVGTPVRIKGRTSLTLSTAEGPAPAADKGGT
jgi:S-adenosylmethionine hydrolase